MRFRKLRIAWSVTWGLVALLLVVLWVRSRTRLEYFHGPLVGGQFLVGNSVGGEMSFGVGTFVDAGRWNWNSEPVSEPYTRLAVSDMTGEGGPLGFGISMNVNQLIVAMPHWFPFLVSTMLTALPWIAHPRWRFSLRTMLIATTLVALVLGAIVWLVR